ncbi:shufflon system plasmid conjugative transfer pilus tip adhesin PilV [Acidithiobacillus sulfuriphilus]|uniref:shufflon system plasmid conjugative transfer pilus tip adhesin PilV n=1 Tax=Acidithiobacillus sulfuriphilus TaxID=1867749 RepID=UPI003F60BB52
MNPIAIVFALIAAAIVAPVVIRGIASYGDQTQASVASIEMSRIEKAADGYITTYAAQVEANSSPTSPAVITVPMLVSTGFLPNGFSANNPYGQAWEVQVLQPQPNQLQALVTSIGGQTIEGRTAAEIATQAGASGGVIGGGSGTFAVPGCNAGAACGAYAGWQVSTNGYQNLAPGHLAALIEYSNGQLQSDYLYRVAVPGQPQLNTMQTNLNMGANSVNNANEVNAQSETLAGGQPNGQPGALQIGSNYYYGDSSNAAVRTPGSFYIQNQNGSGPAQIAEVSNVWGSGELQGGYINSTGDINAQNALTVGPAAGLGPYGFYAYQNGYSGTSDTFTAGSRVILGTAFGSANIGWGCSPNGEIAANANGSGQILACQGGSWQAMGGSAGYTQVSVVGIGGGTTNLGWYKACAESGFNDNGGGATVVYPISGPNAQGQFYWQAGDSGAGTIYEICYN